MIFTIGILTMVITLILQGLNDKYLQSKILNYVFATGFCGGFISMLVSVFILLWKVMP